MEDWRLTNQEKYMLCICLKKIIPSESLLFKNNIYRHEHCELCFVWIKYLLIQKMNVIAL